MSRNAVSNSVIRRLPRYYRFLGELEKNGVIRTSSRELAEKMSLTASQIRQDLNCFGGFGQQGYGYNVHELREQIGNILGVAMNRPMILIGAGNLGKAIAAAIDFGRNGFQLIGIFDINPEIIGKTISGIEVRSTLEIGNFCEENHPSAAVLCIPKEAAEGVANQLISYGIKAFWNFSHYDLSLAHGDVAVENVHLGDSLLTLSFGINNVMNDEKSE